MHRYLANAFSQQRIKLKLEAVLRAADAVLARFENDNTKSAASQLAAVRWMDDAEKVVVVVVEDDAHTIVWVPSVVSAGFFQ